MSVGVTRQRNQFADDLRTKVQDSSCHLLKEVRVVSYSRYDSGKRRTHLVNHGSKEGGDVIPVKVRTRELPEDEFPIVLEESGISDVGPIRALVGSTTNFTNVRASRRDTHGARVASLGVRTRGVLVGKDSVLEGLESAGDVVLAHERDETRESSDGGVGGKTAFDDAAGTIGLSVQAVGIVDIVRGEHATHVKKTMGRIFELRRDIDALVHEMFEVIGADFGS